LLAAAEGRFGLLLLALIALMGAAPLIGASPASHAVLKVFTGIVLVASLHVARPGGRPVAIAIALARLDFLIGQCTVR
jgi:hypothetical protein